ncbi:MAG: PAS domain-containing sensor histidine kinase [Desulfobacterales bacterium]|nr:PAS domain-containing sensor histidine kinase [Desulfobacterales bacterium]
MRVKESVHNLLRWKFRGRADPAAPDADFSRRQEARRLSEERFAAAFKTSLDAVQINRLEDDCYVDINEGFTAITGFGRAEVIGKTSAEVDIWGDGETRARIIDALKQERSLMNMEVRFRGRTGELRTGTVCAMVMNLQGTPHVLTVIRDIDVLKKTEEALAVSEARFRELFNNMSNGVAVFKALEDGDDFVVVDFNRAAERIEGVYRDEVVGRSVSAVFTAAEERGLSDVFRRVWRTGEPEHHPVAIFRHGRLRTWKENYIYRLPSGEIIDVYEDITKRRQAEEKLLAYQEQLKDLTSELCLTEERERRSIATDLHDQIGQTLSVIKMKLFEVRERCLDPDLGGPLAEAMELLKQAIREARSLTFELSPPMLYELGLEAALEWLGEVFQEQHGINCVVTVDREPKPLDEDLRIVLFRSVRELLANVLKHARTRSVDLSVYRREDRVVVVVVDRGVGFDPNEINDRTIRHRGFGLFNIRERLGRLGGRLSLESGPGRGTRVTLSAPLKTEW